MITLDLKGCSSFVNEKQFEDYTARALEALSVLDAGTGAGNDFLGWNRLPSEIKPEMLEDYLSVVDNWIEMEIDLVVIIGIGGSYLGAKAAVEVLSHSFHQMGSSRGPKVVFAGHNLSEEFIAELMDVVSSVKNVACVVISKSGTTTEPAIVFRLIKNYIEETYGTTGARKRIIAITDKQRGALRLLSNQEGYKTFVIEEDIGGRFSVLTAVGLLPIALAGFDISEIVRGAVDMQRICSEPTKENPAIRYAAMRNVLYDSGKKIELLVGFNPKLHYFSEWWKQLFGESEGKDGKGIFPASVNFTTDLHSLGQYIQDGERILFETFIDVRTIRRRVEITYDKQDLDGLNYLAGKNVEFCNKMAQQGTVFAHNDGGVPTMEISIDLIDEYNLGQLFYFFEKACGISAYMLGVNPFDQPGVEDYKKNMFALLGKPGYEREGEELRKRL
ncbi:MAG TPA: glucose-6-phosphate isomerase [Bacteroidales bacterium]|jgi:glucose-6-phosphate isomerase|nr:glucose-6-phosphate isomerase [Bacteroidales bacterium]HPB88630.1 glucose-6-phosphate isomerase [Bacteroidales bacterium]HPY21369.1 glucose-6-phosphate isomerase [Bacteroidales bacterium]HQA92545.1 glucose-6-phosphate isomerase [Bacteroidales bacterium]HQN23296.1 glucose-6-phosphate isomerase [Bacteroidales bacterium]